MKKALFGAVLVMLLALSFLAGHWYTVQDAARSTSASRRILYYIDPMHPAYKSDKPGIAPDCGMQLEPVYADGEGPGEGAAGKQDQMLPGTVRIAPEKQQVIGVRTEVVKKAVVNHVIRALGRVAADETRTYRLIASTDGWIREANDNATGTFVKKDEILASFYSPQFRSAQLSYLSLLISPEDRFQAGGRQALAPSQLASVSMQTYIDALEGLGMSEHQIKELARTKQTTDKIYIMSPVNGFIIARNVSPGQRFDKGTEWYRIADLSRVWVLADLFRNEAEYVKPGMKLKISLPQEKKEFQAVVSKVLPQFDPNSRTLKVRLELDNPAYVLKPDMFVDVEVPVQMPAALAVPVDALIDGIKKTVFVDTGDGYFEPRRVETGWRLGNLIEITGGLMPGEKVVTSGTFLVDSESRMRVAGMGIRDEYTRDPVCGMYLDEMKADMSGRKIEYNGQTYYFCSAECRNEFGKDPKKHSGKKASDKAAAGQRSAQDIHAPGMGTESKTGSNMDHTASQGGHGMDMKGSDQDMPSKGMPDMTPHGMERPQMEMKEDGKHPAPSPQQAPVKK